MHVFETHTCKYLNYDDPRSNQVDVADIARALSQTCRFGGHVTRFYSVAEHAMLVAQLVEHEAAARGFDPASQNLVVRAALHHDSHEAYTGDIPTPLKDYLKAHMGDAWKRLVSKLDLAIGIKVGIPPSVFGGPTVKRGDALALRIEAAHLKSSRGVNEYWKQTGLPVEVMEWRPQFMTSAQAEAAFLQRHEDLTR